jgi:hypothetical protein
VSFGKETGWERDLTGQLILEIVSGSGRFTKEAIDTEATKVSCDYFNAVEVNYKPNGILRIY